MVTSATSATTPPASVGLGSIFQSDTSTSDKTNDVFTKNSQMYLNLFLTQLKNQDPTQPFDTGQMAEQLSQLNNSQQMIQTNKNLATLIDQTKNSQGSQLASFINKEITYLGDTFFENPGQTQNFSYINDKAYDSVTLTVNDAQGNLIAKYDGDNTTGSHDFSWDGKDASGNPVAAGTYVITAGTKDSDGNFSNVSTLIKAQVTGVDFSSSAEPVLLVGDANNKIGVDLTRVASVRDNTSIAAATTPTTTN